MLMLVLLLALAVVVHCEDSIPIELCKANVSVTLTNELLSKGGVFYEKKIVDPNIQVIMPFIIPSSVNIKKISWHLNNGPIDVDPDNKPPVYYTVELVNGEQKIVLVIANPKQHYIGKWQMTVKTEEGTKIGQACFLTSPTLLAHFTESLRATEGHIITAVCKSASIPFPKQMKWYRAQSSADGSVKLLPMPDNDQMTKVPGDTLNFTVSKSDSGVYICNATGFDGHVDSVAAELKVKSRLAALWPFIGILVELIILLVTIIIYEKHKAAKNKKAAETDPLLTAPLNAEGDSKTGSPTHRTFGSLRK